MAEATIQPIEQTFIPDNPNHPGLLAVQHEINFTASNPTEIPDIKNGLAPDGAIAAEASKIIVGALERARFFVREKTIQAQETLQAIRKDPKKLLALGSIGTLAAVASPVIEAAVEKTPVVRHLDKTPDAKATLYGTIPNVPSYESGEYQGDGGYPYANAAPGTVDDMGYPVEQCAAYARWRLIQAGVDPKRAISVTNLDTYRQRGEVVDQNPAAGSMALLSTGVEHAMYVEAYDDETGDVWVSEWNRGGNKYTMRKANVNDFSLDGAGNFYYVHYELPNNKFDQSQLSSVTEVKPVSPVEKFMGAEYDKRNKNAITRNPLKKGKFIQSPNGQYRLVLDKRGATLTLWDVGEGNNDVVWSRNLTKNGKRAPSIKIKKAAKGIRAQQSSTQNVLTFNSLDPEIPVANATRIVLDDNGKFSGFRGRSKTPVWTGATDFTRISRMARVATRKANASHQSTRSTARIHTHTKSR